MAHFVCCYSGLTIKTDHFPMFLSSREPHLCSHPIYHMPQKSLLAYARKWSARELTSTDSYLLFTALLRSTELVYFRTPCQYIPREIIDVDGVPHSVLGTDSVVAHNMERLMIAICRINALQTPSVHFPEVIITPETANLWNAKHWIQNWLDVYDEFHAGRSRQEAIVKQTAREQALQRMIKSPHRTVTSYAKELAEWADDAACFPTFPVFGNSRPAIPLNEYYKEIICHAAAKEFFKINSADLRELLDLLQERIEFSIDRGQNAGGSLQSFMLFKILEDAELYLNSFIKSSAVPVTKLKPSETFRLITQPATSDEPEEFIPGINALLAETPEEAPVRANFPTTLAYIQAKIKWSVAQEKRAAQ